MFKGSDWKEEFDKFKHYRDEEGNTIHFGCNDLEHTEQWEKLKDFISKQISEAYQQGYSEGSLNQSKMQEKLLKNASDNSYQQGKEEERKRIKKLKIPKNVRMAGGTPESAVNAVLDYILNSKE